MSPEVPKTDLEQQAIETLKKYWGYEQFRPHQLEIICSVLKGKDTFALPINNRLKRHTNLKTQ